MTIGSNLFSAILAMDSYNRGYGEGLLFLGGVGAKLGNATIIGQSDTLAGTPGVSAGFYAIAYQIAGDSKVIAYRGTDRNISWPWTDAGSDLWNGYGVGAGSAENKQAELAFKFYQTIAGVGADLTKANISLTGHSLGGGLAGLVGAVYNKNASLFDNMAFEASSINTFSYADFAYRKTTFDPLDPARTEAEKAVLQSVYKDQQPWLPNIAGLHTYSMEGEFLAANRTRQTTAQTQYRLGGIGPDFALPGIDAKAKHSISTLIIRMFADEPGVGLGWSNSAQYFMPLLYNDALAKVVGVDARRGISDSSTVMQDMIAYSAIDTGSADARPFGDTGVRALYRDANTLGNALDIDNKSESLTRNVRSIAKTFVQFSAQLAYGQVLQSLRPEALNGVLSLALGSRTLSVDFSRNLWTLGRAATQTNIVGRQELTESILSREDPRRTSAKGLGAAAFAESIGKIVLATTDVALTTTVPVATDAGKALMFVAAGGDDKLTGSTISDLIYGGLGDDTFYASAGNDVLTGGGGKDSADYSALSSGIMVRAGATALTYTITKPSGTGTVIAEKQLVGSRYGGRVAANMNDPTTAICKEAA